MNSKEKIPNNIPPETLEALRETGRKAMAKALDDINDFPDGELKDKLMKLYNNVLEECKNGETIQEDKEG